MTTASNPSVPLDGGPARARKPALSLFWRTFFLLALLLLGSVIAWTQTLLQMEFEPRALQTADQIASVVNLSRAAVMHSDAIARVSLFKTMKDQEHLTIRLREPKDVFEVFPATDLNRHVVAQLQSRLGADTIVASSVNQVQGLWVGFSIDKDRYWLQTERNRFDQPTRQTWTVWLLTAAVLSLAGAAGIARLINRPLKDLSQAASRVHEGDFEASTLDETVSTQEIRAVNIGFNRMTRKLAQIEQDRTVMLAGISHDLRTPLARLRLEAEMSVPDAQAREAMVGDIAQLDAIIGKFLDYARPGDMRLVPVSLNHMVETCLEPLRKRSDLDFKLALQDGLMVLADPVELQRALVNLLENAARYGKSDGTELARVDISARYSNDKVLLRLRDHGNGVPPEQLKHLTTPFFRGDSARSAANSTGLGLAIVEQTISRMGGAFDLSNANGGGLCANIVLRRATGSAVAA
ncbi:sensor histidine kinase [Rhodoferax fermentans]|uniref:histidine kinase n=1 Tax=Rhodoferax fermentans TaxID=28066 RepID=A0A1T1AV73_RHOFE|nr:sensor histidine kinase [Rhodoferax fermentans]MBK1682009.1 two-component sensor histidine kinase [Rhodoferax fermentans]OOV08000.1 two-component sensor histidine kinase [Rhodoferax fermentans]